MKKLIATLFLICGCASVTASQKACLENVGVSQLAVTVEQAIACSGDQKCIEDAALMRSFVSLDYARACVEGNKD